MSDEPGTKWRYFGRTGGTGKIVDVFRVDAARYDGALDFHHFGAMELLLPDGSWVVGLGERAERNWMAGWFDESDEIDAQAVEHWLRERQSRK